MRILITGATGFVGPHLARELARRGHQVAGTWFGDRPVKADFEAHAADLLDPDELARVISATRPERIVHLAGLSHVGSSWRQMGLYFRVNVLGTENLLAAASGVPVLLASSAEVYGPVPEGEQPIAEDRPPDPASPYALTKAAAERLVVASGGAVARLFNLVGPGQAVTFALPTFARQLRAIARGESAAVLKVGNLEARRDFVHVEDGAAALALLTETASPGAIYQVASGEAVALRRALDLLIEASGQAPRVELDPERLRPQDIPLLQGRATRLRQLGWAPGRDLGVAVADLWASTAAGSEAGR